MVPDRVLGTLAVNPAVLIQDDVSLQVSIVVMGWEEVGDDPGWDAQTAQNWDTVAEHLMKTKDKNQGVDTPEQQRKLTRGS